MLFKIAKERQPSILFFEEVEGLCGSSCDEDVHMNAIRRRLLAEWSAIDSSPERIIIIGATTYPKKIDKLFWSMFGRRVFIPLPDKNAKKQLIANTLSSSKSTAHNISPQQTDLLASHSTQLFSGRDIMKAVVYLQEDHIGVLLSAKTFVKVRCFFFFFAPQLPCTNQVPE